MKMASAIQAVESMNKPHFIFLFSPFLLSLSIINYNYPFLATLDHVSRRPTTRLNTKLSIVLSLSTQK